MLARLIVVSAFAVSMASAAAGQAALAQRGDGAMPSVCNTARNSAESDGASTQETLLAAGLPAGIALSVLAEQPTEQMPGFVRGLTLTVRHLTLVSDAESESRKAKGPLLFYVETGMVRFSIDGLTQQDEEGSAALVETAQNYELRNEGSGPATVLRLSIVPPGEETSIGRGDLAVVSRADDEAAVKPGMIESRLLMSADLPIIKGKTRLFLACLTWAGPAVDPGELVHPGPVAILILRGQLLVGEAGTLVAGECAVFQSQEPHRVRAGDPPPLVLVVGAVPDGVPLWGSPTAGNDARPAGRFEFGCGDPEGPPGGAETTAAPSLDSSSLGRRRAAEGRT